MDEARVAIVVYAGVLAAEYAAYSSVLRALETPGCCRSARLGAIDRRAPRSRNGGDPAGAPGHTLQTPPDEPPVTPLSVMIELVDDDDLARRLERSARRRR